MKIDENCWSIENRMAVKLLDDSKPFYRISDYDRPLHEWGSNFLQQNDHLELADHPILWYLPAQEDCAAIVGIKFRVRLKN